MVHDPFAAPKREALVKEVIGLANADVAGARYILFGINAAAVEGDGTVGIGEDAIAVLKKAHRLVSDLVSPTLQLAFIFDEINGKTVGALEIDGCDFGPYFVAQDYSDSLSTGECWVRDGYELRAVQRDELTAVARLDEEDDEELESVALPDEIDVAVGIGDDPECDFLEIPVPDTSNPPFELQETDGGAPSRLKQVMDTVSTVTTQILRLGQGGAAGRSDETAGDTDAEESEAADQILTDAVNHYYYEEKATKLNLSILNRGEEALVGIRLELGFPQAPDFEVVDRLYTSPFDKRSAAEVANQDYPAVKCGDKGVIVRGDLGELAPARAVQAFQTPLRLAVGPGMQKRKIAVLYTLRGPQDQKIANGRLKIRFGKTAT